jgi:hypothetical protein
MQKMMLPDIPVMETVEIMGDLMRCVLCALGIPMPPFDIVLISFSDRSVETMIGHMREMATQRDYSM